MKLDVSLETMEEKTVYGLWGKSNDRTIAKDIPRLSRAYCQAAGKRAGKVLPFYVLSRNYDERTRGFELFIGGEAEAPERFPCVLEAGAYASIPVRPKLGFLWGPAVGEAKRYFYTGCPPQSGWRARNLEYELHTEKSVGKMPCIGLFFALSRE